jgi:hypothetical protein
MELKGKNRSPKAASAANFLRETFRDSGTGC